MVDTMRPQIVIHGLADAVAALEAARALDVEIILLSAPGAAAFAGPAWFREVVTQAGAAVPEARCEAVLDCGDAPGHALAALREGVTAIAFDGSTDAAMKIRAIAEQLGCRVIDIDYARAFDLGASDDPAAACRAWLAREIGENDA